MRVINNPQITLKVFRFDPDHDPQPYYERFTIPFQERMTVIEGLFYVLEKLEPSLSFRYSCRGAVCGSCAMSIQGANRLACQTMLGSLKGKEITVAPLPYLPVLKDLVVDMEGFYQKFERVVPYLVPHTPPSPKEYLQSPQERKKLDSVTDCIWCAACYSACPILWSDPDYLGPAALVKAYRFEVDSRDKGRQERLRAVDREEGLWRCHTVFNCVQSCPKEINQTEAIEGLRRLALRRRLRWK